MSDAKKARSDAVAKQMGKMLLGGYKMLATSCEDCDCVIMQDKEGNQICVNCDIEGKNPTPALPTPAPEAAAVNAEGEGDQNRSKNYQDELDGYLEAAKVKAMAMAATPAPGPHQEVTMKMFSEIELALLTEMQRTTARFYKYPGDSLADRDAKFHYLNYIGNCADTLRKVRSAVFLPSKN